MQNFNTWWEKSYWNILINWGGGDVPADFSTGGRVPRSPAFGAHDRIYEPKCEKRHWK